jgi:hypothetical protein
MIWSTRRTRAKRAPPNPHDHRLPHRALPLPRLRLPRRPRRLLPGRMPRRPWLRLCRHRVCPEQCSRLAGDLGCSPWDDRRRERLWSCAHGSGPSYAFPVRALRRLLGWAGGATRLFGPRLPRTVLFCAAIRDAEFSVVWRLPIIPVLWRRLGEILAIILGAPLLWSWFRWCGIPLLRSWL